MELVFDIGAVNASFVDMIWRAHKERAHSAVSLLEQGTPILDAALELGYFDQAHLTGSLKRFIGKSLGRALSRLRFFPRRWPLAALGLR